MNSKIKQRVALMLMFILGLSNVVFTNAYNTEGEKSGITTEAVELNEAHQLPMLLGNAIEFNGVRISKSTSRSGNYIDVALSLDSNPGIWAFMTELIFDETILTPISISEEHDLQDLQVAMPPIEGGRYSDRLIFMAYGADISYATGAIATIRFKVNSGQDREFPITLGSLNVTANDELGEMTEFTISTHNESLSQFAPASSFNTNSTGILQIDADNDGQLSVSASNESLSQFTSASSSNSTGILHGDADNNGQLTLFDAVLISRYLAGHLSRPILDSV